MKRILLILTVLFIALLTIQIYSYFPLIYPVNHFEYELEYKKFDVHSDHPIQDKMITVLDDVSDRLNLLPLNHSQRTFKFFICNDPVLFGTFADLAGKPIRTQGMNIQPLYYTFINTTFIEQVGNRYSDSYPHTLLGGDPAHVITHEVIHELIALEIGFLEVRSLPNWKIEGYAEYYASVNNRREDKSTSFRERVEQSYSGSFDELSPGHQFYLESALMIEYLITQKNLSFAEIFQPSVELMDAQKELSDWYQM